MGRRGIKLGTILGVQVTLDPSWFIFGVLFAWIVEDLFQSGGARFPHVTGGAAWLLGAMGSVLFLCSVLAHELSHSVVARRKGIAVHGITLFIFGGVAQITEEPKTPIDEVKIAIAGPATSLVLGLVLFAFSVAAAAVNAKAGEALFAALGFINILLGLFNMLPGFPLDGGRVFRAAVWQKTRDFNRATRVAATSGRVIGIGLIVVGGLLLVLTRDFTDGIWLALIGLFLYQAAFSYYRQASLMPGRGTTVADLMTRQPNWVLATAALDKNLYQGLAAAPDRAFPVVAPEGWLAGILTAEALEAVPPEQWPSLTAGQLMIPMQWELVANPAEPYDAVLARLRTNPVGRFVVLDAGRLVGMLTPARLGRPLASRPAHQGS
ncbi:MAG TPA: site-2 protease family protein [Actinomycetota bacterium]|nr:site-2 protease family protein [Actinomycetota bacterium]